MKKKLASLFLCAAFALCCGCAGDNAPPVIRPGGDPGETPEKTELIDYDAYENDYSFMTLGFFSPQVTRESVQTYMDCGFDRFFLMGNNVGSFGDQRMTAALDLLEEMRVPSEIDAWGAAGLSMINSPSLNYEKYDYLKAILAFDEPTTYYGDAGDRPGIDTVAAQLAGFEKKYGNKEFYANLLPWPANSLGGRSYTEYLQTYLDMIVKKQTTDAQKWICADAYLLMKDRYEENYFKTSWLQNLAWIANAKRDNPDLQLKSRFFIQTMPFVPNNNHVITEADIRLQLYALVAFGFDSAAMFCYATPPVGVEFTEETLALVDRNGEKTPTWYYAQTLNNEIHAFDHVFLQFEYQTAIGIPKKGADENYLNQSFRFLGMVNRESVGDMKTLESIESSEDLLLGYGLDANGNAGFTVVNYNDTALDLTADVTMTFTGVNKAMVYVKGVKKIVNVQDNTLQISLEPGEGQFVIPYYE